MSHKYLDDLLPAGKSPYDFYYTDEVRNQKWEKEREQFSFDEREMWLLDFTFFCWLYEHLRKYKEVSPVDLTSKIIKVNNEWYHSDVTWASQTYSIYKSKYSKEEIPRTWPTAEAVSMCRIPALVGPHCR